MDAVPIQIQISLDIAKPIACTSEYLAERWEVQNPAPVSVISEAITNALEGLIEDTVSDWDWALWDGKVGRQIEDTVETWLHRQRIPFCII